MNLPENHVSATDIDIARCSAAAEQGMPSCTPDVDHDAAGQGSDCQGPELAFGAALSQHLAGVEGKQPYTFAC